MSEVLPACRRATGCGRLLPTANGEAIGRGVPWWGEASRRAASERKQLERNVEMAKKLTMMLAAAVAVAFGARAATETVGGNT